MKVVLKPNKQENYLTSGKEYFVIGIEADYYRIVDDAQEPVLFSQKFFDIVDSQRPKEWIIIFGEHNVEYAYPKEMNAPGFFEDYFDDNPATRLLFWNYIKEKGWDR